MGRPKKNVAAESDVKSIFSGIEFFGGIDKPKGHIGADTPSWACPRHIEELKESINHDERALVDGVVIASEIGNTKSRLKKNREILEGIEESRPKISGTKLDALDADYKALSESIAESLFSRSDMMKGLADPHKEAERMVKPCIKVNPDLAASCGIKVGKDNMVSRNDASRIFRTVGHYLDKETNIEALRRDGK